MNESVVGRALRADLRTNLESVGQFGARGNLCAVGGVETPEQGEAEGTVRKEEARRPSGRSLGRIRGVLRAGKLQPRRPGHARPVRYHRNHPLHGPPNPRRAPYSPCGRT
jgi:hypothetical protein